MCLHWHVLELEGRGPWSLYSSYAYVYMYSYFHLAINDCLTASVDLAAMCITMALLPLVVLTVKVLITAPKK